MIGVVVVVAVVFICSDSNIWGGRVWSKWWCLSNNGVYTGSGSNMGFHGVEVVVPEVVPAYHNHYHLYYLHVCK